MAVLPDPLMKPSCSCCRKTPAQCLLLYTQMYTASQVRRKDKGKEAVEEVEEVEEVEALGSLDDFVAELLGLRTDPCTLPYDQWKQKVGGVGGGEHYERT